MYYTLYTHTYTYGREPCLGCGQIGSTLMGGAAKVINFDRLGKMVRPGTFGKIQVGSRECTQKVPLSKNINK